MDESSLRKKQKLSDQGNDAKSTDVASKLIESGNSAQLREMLGNGELSEINMENGVGKQLLVLAIEAGQLGCVRALLDHLESSATELVGKKSASDYQSCGVAYITRGKHQFLKLNLPFESDSKNESDSANGSNDENDNGGEEQSISGFKPDSESDEPRTKSLVLVACHRRYHHKSGRYYKDYEIAEIEPGAVMSKYIYVDISNLFIEACKKSEIEQVEYLISMGADVNRVDYHGRNAVVMACAAGNVKLMEVLLKHGADVNTRFRPIKRNWKYDLDNNIDDKFCDSDFDEDDWWYADNEDMYGFKENDTLLHIACLPMMKVLLEHGADVNVFNDDGETPFMQVYYRNSSNEEAIDVLLDYVFKHVSDESEGLDGSYPLILACKKADYAMIERMLQHGADVGVGDEVGESPLLCLVRNIHWRKRARNQEFEMGPLVQCAKLLFDYGVETPEDVDGLIRCRYLKAGTELEALLREYTADRKPLVK